MTAVRWEGRGVTGQEQEVRIQGDPLGFLPRRAVLCAGWWPWKALIGGVPWSPCHGMYFSDTDICIFCNHSLQ